MGSYGGQKSGKQGKNYKFYKFHENYNTLKRANKMIGFESGLLKLSQTVSSTYPSKYDKRYQNSARVQRK